MAKAHEEGQAEAEAAGEAEMNDLLVCLGQEETKTERLREKLEELGHDVDALLEGVSADGFADCWAQKYAISGWVGHHTVYAYPRLIHE